MSVEIERMLLFVEREADLMPNFGIVICVYNWDVS